MTHDPYKTSSVNTNKKLMVIACCIGNLLKKNVLMIARKGPAVFKRLKFLIQNTGAGDHCSFSRLFDYTSISRQKYEIPDIFDQSNHGSIGHV